MHLSRPSTEEEGDSGALIGCSVGARVRISWKSSYLQADFANPTLFFSKGISDSDFRC